MIRDRVLFNQIQGLIRSLDVCDRKGFREYDINTQENLPGKKTKGSKRRLGLGYIELYTPVLRSLDTVL